MFHARVEPTIHPQWCTCSDCGLNTRRGRARTRTWAILFIALAAALYGTVIACAPGIAGAFRGASF
jgi:hypothetical protein